MLKLKIDESKTFETTEEEKYSMKEHDLPYICYAIGLHLLAYDPTFESDAIDNMWEDKVLPLALEFYDTPEYKENINNEPFMESLNKFLNNKVKYYVA